MKTTKEILVKNTLWLSSLELISKVVMFFVTVSVVRYFGAANFGRLNYAQSFVGIIMLLSDFGLNTILIRDIAKDKTRVSSYLTSAIVVKAFSSLLVFAALFVVVRTDLSLFFLVALFALAGSTAAIYTAVLSAYEAMQYIFITRLVHYCGVLTSVLLVIYLNLDLHYLVGFYTISSLLSISVALYSLRSLGVKLVAKHDSDLTKKLLIQSLPIFGMLAINQVYMNIDTVMIRHSFSTIEVGYYQAAYKILFAFQAINLITVVTFPRISSLYHSADYAKLKKLARLVVSAMLGIFVPFLLIIYMYSPYITTRIYGASYQPSATVLPYLLTAGLIGFFKVFTGNFFLAANKEKIVFRASLVGLIVNISLNYFLIPNYGFTIAGITLMISEAAALILLLAYLPHFASKKLTYHLPE
jgi:O-antigen/teichoic acid export membrane protein